MRHKYFIARTVRHIISRDLGDNYSGGGHHDQTHPSVSKIPEVDNKVTKVFSSRRLRKARKWTKGMVNQAIRDGHTYIQHTVYGDIDVKVWQELGWEPLTETWNRDIGGFGLTMRMKVPDIPWE